MIINSPVAVHILVSVAFWISDKLTIPSKLVTNPASSARFCTLISSFLKRIFSISNGFSKSYIICFPRSFASFAGSFPAFYNCKIRCAII